MFFDVLFKKLFLAIAFLISLYASEGEEEVIIGKTIPAYFKILNFDKTKWERFADAFPSHPAAQAIKQHLDSIQLEPQVFARDALFSTAFFKSRMRNAYCGELFHGTKPQAPHINVTSDEMYSGILEILADNESDTARFEAWINKEMTSYEKIIRAYNHRLESIGGNNALLRHFLGKIFFAPDAYSNQTLISMRMTLLTEGLVAGDDYLFSEARDLSHTLEHSVLKCIELKGNADTLVIGCGDSLIADVPETSSYLADDFLKTYTGKTFVHDCQHCLCDHSRQITVALTEGGMNAEITYNGAAHADIFADATKPKFWASLKKLKDEERSPIKRIIDHSFILSKHGSQLANCLEVGDEFVTYLDSFEGPLEDYGFQLKETKNVEHRTENLYVKIS